MEITCPWRFVRILRRHSLQLELHHDIEILYGTCDQQAGCLVMYICTYYVWYRLCSSNKHGRYARVGGLSGHLRAQWMQVIATIDSRYVRSLHVSVSAPDNFTWATVSAVIDRASRCACVQWFPFVVWNMSWNSSETFLRKPEFNVPHTSFLHMAPLTTLNRGISVVLTGKIYISWLANIQSANELVSRASVEEPPADSGYI